MRIDGVEGHGGRNGENLVFFFKKKEFLDYFPYICSCKPNVMTTKTFLSILLGAVILSLTAGCSNSKGSSQANGADTITVSERHMNDTTSFNHSNGDRCDIYADLTAQIPTLTGKTERERKLRDLFKHYVLGAPDTLSLEDALRQTVGNSLHQFDFVNQGEAEQEESEMEPVLRYNTNTKITLNYNRNNIATFCRVDVVKKNDNVTSVTHRYYSFDVEKMEYVNLASLFREDALPGITQALRSSLLEQNKVTTDDQLNELGYFNIDNLSVNNNFYFVDDGITWSYLPGELAVDALGEPAITLSLDALRPFMSDSSQLKNLQ